MAAIRQFGQSVSGFEHAVAKIREGLAIGRRQRGNVFPEEPELLLRAGAPFRDRQAVPVAVIDFLPVIFYLQRELFALRDVMREIAAALQWR